MEYMIVGMPALTAGVLLGGFFGFRLADRRLKRLYEEVRAEVVRVKLVAEDKLGRDNSEIDKLLRELNDSVQHTFEAAAALETHSQEIARKTEGAREIIATSKFIVDQLDEFDGDGVGEDGMADHRDHKAARFSRS